MKLDQLAARYNPDQDRILLRMNTSDSDELRLWLTRRLCLNLWPKFKAIVAQQVALEQGAKDPARAAAATASIFPMVSRESIPEGCETIAGG